MLVEFDEFPAEGPWVADYVPQTVRRKDDCGAGNLTLVVGSVRLAGHAQDLLAEAHYAAQPGDQQAIQSVQRNPGPFALRRPRHRPPAPPIL